jgi:acetyl-CoA carboxylase carboxyltransferase component
MKVLAAHRRALEASIVKLAHDRARIDTELRLMTAALTALEARKPKDRRKKGKMDLRERTRRLLDTHSRVTVTDAAAELGTSATYASTLLSQLGTRVSRGIYKAKVKK